MSSERRDALIRLILELLEEAEKTLDGPLESGTSLVESGLLDSLSLLEVAGWVSDELGGELDIESIDIRSEWDTIDAILEYVEHRT